MDSHRDPLAASPKGAVAPRSVAIITNVFPEPRDSGKKVMIAAVLAYWRSRVGADRVHLVLVGNEVAETTGVDVVVHRVARAGVVRQVLNVLGRSLLTRRHTLQESALYSPKARHELASVLEKVGADLEIFDTIRMGQYAEEIPARPGVRRIVFLDDLFSVRYQRMLTLMREHPEVDFDPLGDFRANLPGVVGRIADRRLVRRALLTWERSVVAQRERRVAELFETALLVSPEETRRLSELSPGARVRELRPVLDVPARQRLPAPERPTFVLLGLLTLAHNADGAQVFLDECLPGVLRALPDARIHIVGRGAPPSLAEAASEHGEAVAMDGYVEDLDALLGRATALVMPLRFGSGIKIKVIEALARGLPVVSTPVGAEGLETGADRGILVESDPARFGAVLAQVADPERNRALSAAARRHYEDRYTEKAALRSYDEAFGLGPDL